MIYLQMIRWRLTLLRAVPGANARRAEVVPTKEARVSGHEPRVSLQGGFPHNRHTLLVIVIRENK